MGRSGPAEASGWPRHARARPRVGERRLEAHTTTPHLEREEESRGRRRLAERGEVAPLVRLIERMVVVGGVRRVKRRPTMPSEQRCERFVEKSCVGEPRTELSRAGYEPLVHGRTHPDPCHATIMP